MGEEGSIYITTLKFQIHLGSYLFVGPASLTRRANQ